MHNRAARACYKQLNSCQLNFSDTCSPGENSLSLNSCSLNSPGLVSPDSNSFVRKYADRQLVDTRIDVVKTKKLRQMNTLPAKPPSVVQRGFTLIEIAIVLVVVALILTGMLKGQALIDSARVRSMATEVSGIRAAWYSFQDRYRSLPGDFPNARNQIDDATIPGNGNGKIDDSSERAGVWQQLAMAGLINGNFDGLESSAGTAQDVNCAASTCPRNPFNGFYKISYGAQAANASGPANEIFTGDGIPVYILAQLDNKLDDGLADSGSFRVHRDYSNSCATGSQWNVSRGHSNCAAVLRE